MSATGVVVLFLVIFITLLAVQAAVWPYPWRRGLLIVPSHRVRFLRAAGALTLLVIVMVLLVFSIQKSRWPWEVWSAWFPREEVVAVTEKTVIRSAPFRVPETIILRVDPDKPIRLQLDSSSPIKIVVEEKDKAAIVRREAKRSAASSRVKEPRRTRPDCCPSASVRERPGPRFTYPDRFDR